MRPEAHTAHEDSDLFIRRSQSLLPSDSSVSTFGKVGSLLFFLIEAKLVDVLRVPAGAQWLLCSEPNGGAGGIRKLIDFVLNHVFIKSCY